MGSGGDVDLLLRGTVFLDQQMGWMVSFSGRGGEYLSDEGDAAHSISALIGTKGKEKNIFIYDLLPHNSMCCRVYRYVSAKVKKREHSVTSKSGGIRQTEERLDSFR